jgi:hypothetical protein
MGGRGSGCCRPSAASPSCCCQGRRRRPGLWRGRPMCSGRRRRARRRSLRQPPRPGRRMKSRTHLTDNAAWSGASAEAVGADPLFRDDPTRLLAALDRVGRATARGEWSLDDGSGDAALAERVASAVRQLALPARFVRLEANEGRSQGPQPPGQRRPRAVGFLFLDADMLPDRRGLPRSLSGLIDGRRPGSGLRRLFPRPGAEDRRPRRPPGDGPA